MLFFTYFAGIICESSCCTCEELLNPENTDFVSFILYPTTSPNYFNSPGKCSSDLSGLPIKQTRSSAQRKFLTPYSELLHPEYFSLLAKISNAILKSNGNKRHPCLTPLLIFSSWDKQSSNHILAACLLYKMDPHLLNLGPTPILLTLLDF